MILGWQTFKKETPKYKWGKIQRQKEIQNNINGGTRI